MILCVVLGGDKSQQPHKAKEAGEQGNCKRGQGRPHLKVVPDLPWATRARITQTCAEHQATGMHRPTITLDTQRPLDSAMLRSCDHPYLSPSLKDRQRRHIAMCWLSCCGHGEQGF